MTNRILNIIGWLGTALVIVALGIRFGLPAQDQYAFYLAWAGLVCILAYMLSQWREFAKMFTRRQARYGTLTGVSVLVVLGILVALNYIGKRQNKRWDLTEAKQFSLSDQTRNILSKLDAPLKITAFVQEPEFQTYQDRLKEYQYGSKQVSTELVDPDKKPTIAQQNGVQQYGTIVLNYKERTEKVTSNTEQDITNGIIKVVTGQQKKVYFSQGHGEKDTAASDREGYSSIASALGGDNYTAEKLVLLQQGSVPADATVVIAAGPKIDFLPPEIEALKTYLGKNGKLLLELDPPEKIDSPPLTNLIALAHDWGVEVGNNVVVDVSGMGRLLGTDASIPVAANYPSHPITERFNVFTAYPMARSAAPVSGGVNGHTAQTFVESSPRSWAETDIKTMLSTGKVEMDKVKDKPGPVSLAAAVSFAAPPDPAAKPEEPGTPRPETRVVVFGDSDFAGNSGLGIQGNRDLFLNTIGWLSQQENLISIRTKEASDRRLTLTSAQQTNIMWGTMLGIPVIVFGMGIYTWRRRRG